MSKMNTEKKVVDQKTSPSRLRTLSAQTLEEVVGGSGYIHYTLRDLDIGGY
ncbi:MAG TPA: hypothetical protein VFV14_00220 [Myxococcaceae bacterium]|nr:hypothetical protein [Myxococcaceae bacterium]